MISPEKFLVENKLLLKIPNGPRSIQKGGTLKTLLDKEAIQCLGKNISIVYPEFKIKDFILEARKNIDSLGIIGRGHHLSHALKKHLPENYSLGINILMQSLTPALTKTSGNGLGVFFYLPHICFVSNYGLDKIFNGGKDPFPISMKAQYELTRRFTAEFSMRFFLIKWPKRTLIELLKWTNDKDPHVRRLCSEGCRPRLPWAIKIPYLIENPDPVLPILEKLKDDPDLYVRRSVANHLGDIAKDHPQLVFKICEEWIKGASSERKWLIRHALRHPSKKGIKEALKIRKLAQTVRHK